MATDFWASSHNKRWIVDRATLKQARSEDLQYVESAEHIDFLNIYFANLIAMLGKRLPLRQRVIATATVFFRRFYVKNLYCETDPFMVIAACCYVAAKAEESPVHIKNVVSESRQMFSQEGYGIKNFPSDNSKLAEMEFYLVSDLECDLVVFHPYRTLLTLCGREAAHAVVSEAGEVGVGIDNGPRYWGTGEGRLELGEGPLQTAWHVVIPYSNLTERCAFELFHRFIINDTYRSELCLLYPPHMIAIAAIYLTLVLNDKTRDAIQAQSAAPAPPPRRSSRTNTGSAHRKPAPVPQQDFVGFMAGLRVSLPTVAMIAQEILSLYTLWERYSDTAPESGLGASAASGVSAGDDVVTPAFLTQLLLRMREARLADLAHPASGQPMATNKRLGRTQAVG
ncbi:cyclin-like protein [Russula earlei]|uniref:Cyclin-like protein n=1 Tax=Russula earlei TaxID=71964 RepID=A0ACC0UPI0_9AGAM|nr:cyclin-like protein [Russula earlei]